MSTIIVYINKIKGFDGWYLIFLRCNCAGKMEVNGYFGPIKTLCELVKRINANGKIYSATLF